jgi:hypothetical protein
MQLKGKLCGSPVQLAKLMTYDDKPYSLEDEAKAKSEILAVASVS